MLTRVMCYDTTACSTRVVRVGLCVRIFGRGFLPMYEYREVSTPRNFSEVTKLSENIRKPCLKATLKEIKNIINN